jgi:SAM-dependent methyltransferase
VSDYRSESRRVWDDAAEGWGTLSDAERGASMPVTAALLDLARLQPGHRVLELAAGPGEVGFHAYEQIQPGGQLITSDFAPGMLTQAQQRAEALGLRDVRFKQIDAESIDLEAASQDAVLCRWGYMLMADPAAALRETRRVLRPGGRVALATWATAEENPWSSLVGRTLIRLGLIEPPPPGPGQFAWGDPAIITEHLEGAGFVEDVEVRGVDFENAYDGVDGWIDSIARLAARTRPLLREHGDVVRPALAEAAAPFERDGRLVFPARCWVAGATA